MPLHPTLLGLLACPQDKGPLVYVPARGVLYNPRLRRKYPIVDDVPVLLTSEATTASDDEHRELTQP